MDCSYTWNFEEYSRAQKYYWLSRIRRSIRWSIHALAVVLLAIAVSSMFDSGFSWPSLVVLFLASYWLFLGRIERRFVHKWKFGKNPARNRVINWQFNDVSIAGHVDGLADSETLWEGIIEALMAKEGILLLPQPGIFYWVPNSGFSSPAESEGFRELVRHKVHQIRDVT